MADNRRSVVIGIGNPDRGDDAVGRAVTQWLHGKMSPDVEVIEQEGEMTSLLACIEDVSSAYLIDACSAGGPAGRVLRFDVAAAPLPYGTFNMSTHGPGLAEAIELARALDQLPARCIVYAVEAQSFEQGAPLSAPVRAAVAAVGEQVREEICGADAPEGRPNA